MDVATLRRALEPTEASDETLAEALPHYEEAMRAAQINNPKRAAAWHSQLGHESAGLRYMAEIRRTHPSWNWDRTRYRGRGPIQLTWQGNYRRFGQWCAANGYTDDPELFVNEPELVETFKWGFLAASWYWLHGGPRPGELNAFADAGDILRVSWGVNGWREPNMPNGWDDDDNSRLPRYNRAIELGEAGLPSRGGPQVPATIRPNPKWRGDPVFLPELLRAWGVEVEEFPGWRDRGHGDFGEIRGVVMHHTGSFGETPNGIANHPSLGLCSQIYLGRTGKAVICGAGIAWHAGPGGGIPWLPDGDANRYTIGIEAANDGGGRAPGRRDAWSTEQYEAYTTICAAICWYLGHSAERVIMHKTWAGASQGKWDPGGLELDDVRRDVQAKIDAGPPGARDVIAEAAGAHPWLGKLVEGPNRTADGRGQWASFEHGHMYWHPEVGAVPVPALLFETYTELGWEMGPLGFPIMVHTVVADEGDVQAYQRGVLFRQYGKPGYFVTGAIGDRYRRLDWQGGPLGWPTSNETRKGDTIYQTFEHGTITWSPDGTTALKATEETLL